MEKKVLYKYIKIDLEQFATFEENIDNDINDIQVQSETTFYYNKENNVLRNRLSVAYMKDTHVLMKGIINSDFLIHKESVELLEDEQKRIIFPVNVLVQFASLNYGTLRGVLFLKTERSALENFILPPIFFNQFINQEYVVE